MALIDDTATGSTRWLHKKNTLPPAPTEDTGADTGVDTAVEAGEWAPWDELGPGLRRRDWAAKHGFYAPALTGAPSTTRQAGILNTALIAPPTDHEGVAAGRDVLSQTAMSNDPFTSYNSVPKKVTSPNVVNIGDVGSGKSSYSKTVDAIRPLILRNRRVAVFDKKPNDADPSIGEWSPVAEFFHGTSVRFSLDGTGHKFNLLDRMIAGKNDASGDNQLDFFYSIPAMLRAGQGADEWERKAIRLGHRRLARAFETGRTPTLADFTAVLGVMDTAGERSLAGMSGPAVERLHQAGMSMRWVFDDLLDSYGEIFDGETSAGVSLDPKLTHIDISQLPDTGPLIPMLMSVMNLWVLGTIRRNPGIRTTLIWEEAWYLFLSDVLARLAQSNQKLSRGLGLSNVYNLHKGDNDIPAGSPGMSVIQEAQTVRLFNQGKADAARWCVDTFGLNEESFHTIQRLQPGHHLLKVGSRDAEIEVEHIRSAVEIRLTDTDQALRGKT